MLVWAALIVFLEGEGEQDGASLLSPCFPGPLFSPQTRLLFLSWEWGNPLAGLSWRIGMREALGLTVLKNSGYADNQEVVAVSLGALLPNRNSLEGALKKPEGSHSGEGKEGERSGGLLLQPPSEIWPPRGQELPWSLPLLSGDGRRAVCPPTPPLPRLSARLCGCMGRHSSRTQVVLLEDAGRGAVGAMLCTWAPAPGECDMSHRHAGGEERHLPAQPQPTS